MRSGLFFSMPSSRMVTTMPLPVIPIFHASCTLMSSLPPRFKYLRFGLRNQFSAWRRITRVEEYEPHERELGILDVDQVVEDSVGVNDVQLVLDES